MGIDPATQQPDAAAIDLAAARWRPTGSCQLPRGKGFQVVYKQAAMQAILKHGGSRTDVEVGGVLLGKLCRDEHGPYLLVDAAIAALAARQRAANVSFTADTWTLIHQQIDQHHKGKRIVGWYHTHPGFGVFLSEMDVFIQRSFFEQPDLVALVFDPVSGDIGSFVWRNGQPNRETHLVETDKLEPSHKSSRRQRPAQHHKTSPPESTPVATPKRPRRLLAVGAVALLISLAAMFMYLKWLDANEPVGGAPRTLTP